MKKMTVDDVVARLLMQQKIVVLERDAKSRVANRLCDETTVSYYEDGLWRTLGKRTVWALDAKNDVLYIYVEEMGDKK